MSLQVQALADAGLVPCDLATPDSSEAVTNVIRCGAAAATAEIARRAEVIKPRWYLFTVRWVEGGEFRWGNVLGYGTDEFAARDHAAERLCAARGIERWRFLGASLVK